MPARLATGRATRATAFTGDGGRELQLDVSQHGEGYAAAYDMGIRVA